MSGARDVAAVEWTRLQRRLERERRARSESEAIGERALRELYTKQQEVELLRAIAVAANESARLEEALQICLDRVCAHTGWPVGHVYVLAEEAPGALASTAIWHLEHPERFETFRQATEATRLASGVGLPGRVLATGKPVWIMDVTRDPNFPRAQVATDIGVRAGFGFPVWVGMEVVAVLEFFSPEAVELDAPLLEVMAHIGTQLGRVIERTRAEEALRASEERYRSLYQEAQTQRLKAEAASRAKSDFLANMSHEMRTPMNAIMGMADLLAETPLTAEQREYVRIAQGAGETLLTLIDDILDLSTMEAGQMALVAMEFDLGELVDKTAAFLAMPAHDKGLELVCQVRQDVPTGLVGDPHRLRQVLINLLGNAIKFTEYGEVVLQVEPDPDTHEAGTLHFSIADTGIGIPPEQREAIFERFTQVDASITRQYGGTGLGLAICRRLVELMGGRLWVDSQVGHGSTFHFTAHFGLQTAPAPRRPQPPVASPAAPEEQRPLRILLVEDSADNRALIQSYLKSTPYQLEIAEHGAIAVGKFRSGHYDLVLMDMQMPVMDGYTASKTIRTWEGAQGVRGTPIIALTAHALPEDVHKSLEAGCTAHLSKPIKKATLLAAIDAHTRSATP